MNLTWESWATAISNDIRSVPDHFLKQAAVMVSTSPLILTAGNGGSAALASHAAQAFMKPQYQAGLGLAAVCVTDTISTLTAHANDGGWLSALRNVAIPFFPLHPVLLLISSSGNSTNIVELAREARAQDCAIIALTGFNGGALRQLATLSLHVDSDDYEVVEPVHDALLHRIQYHLRTRS